MPATDSPLALICSFQTDASTHSPERRQLALVLPESRQTVTFYLDGPELRWGHGAPDLPTVNWSGIGPSTIADTRAFAAALQVCAALAEKLDGQIVDPENVRA